MRLWLFVLPLLLAACGSGGGNAIISNDTTTAPTTISDPARFLAASRCSDGSLAVLNACAGAPQQSADPMLFRRHDNSGQTGDQVEDAYAASGGYVTSFAYPPHRAFVPANGDGGDFIVVDGARVRIDFTQNGAPNGGTIYGYWVGPKCGGDGWLLFDTAAPTGSWASAIAMLSSAKDPSACPALNAAFTRWRLESADIPLLLDGAAHTVTSPIVVTEHFDGLSIATSRAMERVVMAQDIGRVIWEAWTTAPAAPATWSCPGIAPWNDAPADGWYMHDRRCLLDVRSDDGSMSGTTFGWGEHP